MPAPTIAFPHAQKFEGEGNSKSSTIIFSISADHDQKISRSVVTKQHKRTDDRVEKMDEKLWSQLPEDLLPKIFARLPFSCLINICLLSKAWEANVRSPSFQMEVTTEVSAKWDTYSPLLCSSDGLQLVAYSRASRQWQSLFSLSSYLFGTGGAQPSFSSWKMISINAGSLVCLKPAGRPGQRGLLVTNPLLKSWRFLPPHGSMTQFLPIYEIIHLVCSDSMTENSSAYKVISISQDSSIRDPSKKSPPPFRPQHPEQQQQYDDQQVELMMTSLRAEVYDSTTRVWTANESGLLMPMDLHNVSSVYVDGTVYFLLASSRYESFHMFAYNVRTGSWTAIPHPLPQKACSLAQLVVCGSSVLLVLLCTPAASNGRHRQFGLSSWIRAVSKGSVYIFKIGQDMNITEISGGPAETIQGVEIVEGISGDEECIYLQAFGRPLVVVFNLQQKLWSTVSLVHESSDAMHDFEKLQKLSSRYFGASFNWTNSSFQPGSNPFMEP